MRNGGFVGLIWFVLVGFPLFSLAEEPYAGVSFEHKDIIVYGTSLRLEPDTQSDPGKMEIVLLEGFSLESTYRDFEKEIEEMRSRIDQIVPGAQVDLGLEERTVEDDTAVVVYAGITRGINTLEVVVTLSDRSTIYADWQRAVNLILEEYKKG